MSSTGPSSISSGPTCQLAPAKAVIDSLTNSLPITVPPQADPPNYIDGFRAVSEALSENAVGSADGVPPTESTSSMAVPRNGTGWPPRGSESTSDSTFPVDTTRGFGYKRHADPVDSTNEEYVDERVVIDEHIGVPAGKKRTHVTLPVLSMDTWEEHRKWLVALSQTQILELLVRSMIAHNDVYEAVKEAVDEIPTSKRLMIRNIHFQTDNSLFYAAFQRFGEIEDFTIVRDRDTGRSKGFGFITYARAESARLALTTPVVLDNRSLVVKLAVDTGTEQAGGPYGLRPRLQTPSHSDGGQVGDLRTQRKLFVRNLTDSTDTAKLRATFAPYGPLEDCAVIHDATTGRPKGYGFVTFSRVEDAIRAGRENQRMIGGQMVFVSFALPPGSGGMASNSSDSVPRPVSRNLPPYNLPMMTGTPQTSLASNRPPIHSVRVGDMREVSSSHNVPQVNTVYEYPQSGSVAGSQGQPIGLGYPGTPNYNIPQSPSGQGPATYGMSYSHPVPPPHYAATAAPPATYRHQIGSSSHHSPSTSGYAMTPHINPHHQVHTNDEAEAAKQGVSFNRDHTAGVGGQGTLYNTTHQSSRVSECWW